MKWRKGSKFALLFENEWHKNEAKIYIYKALMICRRMHASDMKIWD